MLHELSNMDRITQLQDEIQQVCLHPSTDFLGINAMPQLVTIMSNSIAYLTERSNFVQVSPGIPITKQRNPEKYDQPDVFEGMFKRAIGGRIRFAEGRSEQKGTCQGFNCEGEAGGISDQFVTRARACGRASELRYTCLLRVC